jgi:hypothetical protein
MKGLLVCVPTNNVNVELPFEVEEKRRDNQEG